MRKHFHSLPSNAPPQTCHSNLFLLAAVYSSAVRSCRSKLRHLKKGNFCSSQIVSSGYQMRTRLATANLSRRDLLAIPVPLLARQWSATGVKAMRTFPNSRIIEHPPCYPAASLSSPRGAREGTPAAVLRRSGYTKAILNWSTSTLSCPLHWSRPRITGWRFSVHTLPLLYTPVSVAGAFALRSGANYLEQRAMRSAMHG